jgi:diguanylate cyclase (GGDEF)-like protein
VPQQTGTQPIDIETGQFRRTPIEWRIDQIIEAIHKDGAGVLSVVYLDIDGFGRIEEEHGYGIADALLEAIAEYLRGQEKADFCARYVRDSFLIIYQGLGLEEAFLEAEMLRRALSGKTFSIQAEGKVVDICVIFSAGVATYPGDPEDRHELISLAEEAARRSYEGGGGKAIFGRSTNMTPKTSHYSPAQLDRLRHLREALGRSDASLLREALDDLLRKYDQRDVRRGVAERIYGWMTGGKERKVSAD